MSDLVEDSLSRRMPYKWFWVRVGRGEEFVDRRNQFWDTLKTISPHPLLRQLSEPSLYQVQPGRTGRDKVEYEARMFLQPRLHFGLLMSPVVVHDEVQRCAPREFTVQPPQKVQEFLMTVLVPISLKVGRVLGAK